MKSSRFVFLLLVLCCFMIIGMIVVINLPHTTPQTGAIPALYPTSFPSAQHDFPKNPQIPVFQSDTSKYQYLGDILYNLPDTFTLPKNMAGYTVDSYSITAVQAEALAQSLGLQTTPEQATTQTENYLTWSSENGVHLQIALQSGSIEYSNSYVPGKSDAVKKIDTKEAVVAAVACYSPMYPQILLALPTLVKTAVSLFHQIPLSQRRSFLFLLQENLMESHSIPITETIHKLSSG
jgi:hypothetical protein